VPDALDVLALVIPLLGHVGLRPKLHDRILMSRNVVIPDLGRAFEYSISDLGRVVIVGIWAFADELAQSPHRPELIAVITNHFNAAFGLNEDKLYENVEIYIFGRAMAQIIALGWLPNETVVEAFRCACTALQEIDPAGGKIKFNGVLNVVAAVGAIDPQMCVFTEVANFAETCFAVIQAGWLFDNHARWVMEQLLSSRAAVAAHQEAIREIRSALNDRNNAAQPKSGASELDLLAQFAGWRQLSPEDGLSPDSI
jgi:hypothetical protein